MWPNAEGVDFDVVGGDKNLITISHVVSGSLKVHTVRAVSFPGDLGLWNIVRFRRRQKRLWSDVHVDASNPCGHGMAVCKTED